MQIAKISSKGQLTLPSAIRRRLGLRSGESVSVQWNADGSVTLRPYRPGQDDGLAGSLHEYAGREPATPEDMDRAVRERARRKFRRA